MLFVRAREAARHYVPYNGALTRSDKGKCKKNHARESTDRNHRLPVQRDNAQTPVAQGFGQGATMHPTWLHLFIGRRTIRPTFSLLPAYLSGIRRRKHG
ncbi:hypothetical protein Bxe_A0048 [Paraburkholderia xenovorans LB400]|uniref:Uncharacterized protein n=1 Tax=Paraburkholderia xenovorans (strain LB400) TaxID=266265 RepID=Q13SR0_PARXL|nr:hypothetical protein Bxe_A0048 [Paraburkholderia xenovorans LB400]